MSTFNDKLKISLGSASLFAGINMPQVYGLTDSVLPLDTYNPITACPTMIGQLTHTVVFFLISFLTMRNPMIPTLTKIKHSLYGSLIQFLLSSPAMYSLTGSLFGPQIASSDGCPTLIGILLHTVVYTMALVGVMYLPE
tara:strand:+ start:2117 stop:2533 length:417 start_codon:yes stop_codon:yes gene_type:complete